MGRPQEWVASLHARELGARSFAGARAVDSTALSLRADRLQLSAHLELSQPSGAVISLSLEGIEERYLLAGCADASISLYDVADKPTMSRGPPDARAPIVRTTKRSCPAGHTSGVTCLQWFPHDTGAFVSSAVDATVKLWDTNNMAPVCSFETAGRVHCSCMSGIASKHNLIATSSDGDGGDVVLFDPLVGHMAHRLAGHRGIPWSLCWSPRSEYELVSGGADGSLRLWDIRKNIRGCLRAFDQHHTFARVAASSAAPSRPSEVPGVARDTTASVYDILAAEQHGRGGRGVAGSSRSVGSGLQSGSLAATARKLADPKAHHGGITSVAFAEDGTVLLSAGRDHRLRLWNASSGENLLVHYADAYNSTRTHLQLALSARLGRAGSRVYFPSADALRVYNLYSGQLLQELKGHFGDVHCATASSGDVKVFSGGGDCAILTWTPPPCGLTAPAPPEECEAAGAPFDTTSAASQVRYAGLGTGSIVDFIEAPSSLAGAAVAPRGGAAGAGARAVAADGDAWSDDDEPPPPTPTRRAPVKRRRRGG